MESRPIQVLLVDDHAVVRAGYSRLLKQADDIDVAGEADSGECAYAACRQAHFNVIVMDISLPGMSGIEATKRILSRYPGIHVLMFSVHEEHIFVRRALAAGATGYISKRAVADVLVDAVRSVAAGQRYLCDAIDAIPRASAECGTGDAGNFDLARLSPREFEIFRLLASGGSVNVIAEALYLSRKTVANHSSRLRAKLGTSGTADLTRLAIRSGVVSA